MLKNLTTWLKRPYTLCILVGAALAFTPLSILAYAVFIYIGAQSLRLPFGLIGRLALSFLLLTSVISCLAAVAWMVHVPVSVAAVLSLIGLGFLVANMRLAKSPPRLTPTRKDLLNKNDLVAFFTALVFAGILIFPLLPKPDAGTLAPVIMAGGDNSAHMNMLKTIDQNKGLAIGTDNAYNLRGILVAYPQGWHLNAAFIKWALSPLVDLSGPVRFMALFYAVSSLWFCLLVFMMTRIALWLLADLRKKARSHQSLWPRIVVALVCAIGLMAPIISLFTYGFQTQVAALVLLLLEILFVILSLEAKAGPAKYGWLLLAGIALAGSNFSWLFLLPIGGLLLLGGFIHALWITKKVPWLFVGVGIVVLACIAFQPGVQIAVKTPEYTDGIFNQRGSVFETNLLPLLALFLAVSLFTISVFKGWRLRILYLGALLALIFSIGILIFQLQTVGEPRYYYFKSTYTYILLVTIVAAAVAAMTVEGIVHPLRRRASRIAAVGLSLTLGVLLLIYWQAPAFGHFFNQGLRGISVQQAHAVTGIISHNPKDALHITPIGSCNRGDDIRATQLAYALTYAPPGKITSFSAFELSFLNKEYLFQSMKEFVEREKFYLIVLSSDLVLSNELKAWLGESMRYITLVNLDATPETEPVNQCPDRIRALTPEEKARGIL